MFGRCSYLQLITVRLVVLPMPLQVIYKREHRMNILEYLVKWPV